MELIILLISIVAVIIAYFQLMVPISKGEVILKREFPFIFRSDVIIKKNDNFFDSHLRAQFEKLSNSKKILSYIWYYPLGGGNQASWGVKESQVLLGNLSKAIENPGLGIAIFSVELGLDIFGVDALERIEGCINWAIVKTQKEPPFLLQEKMITDNRITKIEIKSDFRHTLALSIILSKSQQKPAYLMEYVKYTLNLQRSDGGWSPGNGVTVSEVFTVLYAIELLYLNMQNNLFDHQTKEKIKSSIINSIRWLIENTNDTNLWESGSLKEYWDSLMTSSWILRRLLPLHLEQFNENWIQKINLAVQSLIKISTEDSTWNKSDYLQKFRVESRIASAIYEGVCEKYYNSISNELSNSFLNDWRRRANSILDNIKFEDFDLSTALFLAKPLIGYDELIKLKKEILLLNRKK